MKIYDLHAWRSVLKPGWTQAAQMAPLHQSGCRLIEMEHRP